MVYARSCQCCGLPTARRSRSVERRFSALHVICSCSQWQATRHISTLLSSCSAVLRVLNSGLKQPCKTVHKVLKSMLRRLMRRGLTVRKLYRDCLRGDTSIALPHKREAAQRHRRFDCGLYTKPVVRLSPLHLTLFFKAQGDQSSPSWESCRNLKAQRGLACLR